jgi:hypothetical protein
MNEKINQNDTQRGGQSDAETDNEEGESNQDREDETQMKFIDYILSEVELRLRNQFE